MIVSADGLSWAKVNLPFYASFFGVLGPVPGEGTFVLSQYGNAAATISEPPVT